jgi:hypothetical protein
MTTIISKGFTTVDSCTVTARGQALPVFKTGTKVSVTVGDVTIEGLSGFSSAQMFCFTKGSAPAKALSMELSKKFQKGTPQAVTLEYLSGQE